MGAFNSKFFNSEVFGRYLETVPRVKQNALLNAGIFNVRNDLSAMLKDQVGGNFITVPMVGLIDGEAVNYDGSTKITDTSIGTYSQSMIVVGRAKAWRERDFSADMTGHDFMGEIGKQVSDYWDGVNQGILLSILKGVFAMTTGGNNFASNHTLDITGETVKTVGATTLNTAIQKAAGANKNIFSLAIMHSAVATNLENLQLLEYAKYTDSNGIMKDMALATWNGRTVLIDDDVPVGVVGGSGSDKDDPVYTTYVLGKNAFDYANVGAKVPAETWRDPATNGGEDVLYTRERVLYAPRGISFHQPNTPIVSPTNAQLETGTNWRVVTDAAGSGYINDKAIPIARIVSKG